MRHPAAALLLLCSFHLVAAPHASAQEETEEASVDPNALFADALQRYERGGVTAAYRDFKTVVQLAPMNVDAVYNVASIAASQERAADCVLYTRSYLALMPGDPETEELERQATRCERMLEERGTLQVNVETPGARIYVNGLYMGDASFGPLTVPVDRYEIAAALEDFDPFVETVEVADGGAASSTVRLASITYYGSVALTVSVEGATILVDGTSIGTSPVAEPVRLPVGRYLFEVQQPGFHPWRRYIDISRDVDDAIEVRLLDESINLDDL
jgi:hypothetical protein